MKSKFNAIMFLLILMTSCVNNTFKETKEYKINSKGDIALQLYNNSATRRKTIDYFTSFTKNREITKIIFEEAIKNDISPSLAFALAWNESRFKPLAYNNKNPNGSIDRGLFQLNSSSFPNLSKNDFYNPKINAKYGLQHLNYCMKAGKNEITALAIYNAGRTRVVKRGAPKMTLDYISNILNYKQKIESGLDIRFLNDNKNLKIAIK